jgi:hypothetical protein
MIFKMAEDVRMTDGRVARRAGKPVNQYAGVAETHQGVRPRRLFRFRRRPCSSWRLPALTGQTVKGRFLGCFAVVDSHPPVLPGIMYASD